MSQSERAEILSLGDEKRPFPAVAGLGKRIARRLLANIVAGRLMLTLPSGETLEVAGPQPGPEASLNMRRWRGVWRCLVAGDIGFAEGFIEGDWTTPNLAMLIRFFSRNAPELQKTISGNTVVRAFERLRYALRRNSKRGSRKNIVAHYDLGNDFYRLWLDRTMSYSSAIFPDGATSLEEAQAFKIRRVRALLALCGGERVLEIGCGWGALAADLAECGGADVKGITLSPSQLDYARQTVETRGLEEKVSLELRDYRDVNDVYDRIVSIEMFEAVGEAYWPDYFETLARTLKPLGHAVLQVISISDERYEDYRRTGDFIQKYIFPGGFLPSPTSFRESAERAGLVISSVEYFAESYADTLAEWRRRFEERWNEIAALGFNEKFKRMWLYYLEYCEAGFRDRAIDVGLYVLRKA